MKSSFVIIAVTAACALSLTSTPAHAENRFVMACKNLLKVFQPAKDSAAREARMGETEAWQISMLDGSLIGRSDTPPFYFEAEEGPKVTEIAKSQGLHGDFTRLTVTGLGAKGILRGTVLAPVSGHTGFENAKKWSKTDTFTIGMQVGTGANGDQFGSYEQNLVTLAKDVPSMDLVTRQDIEIPMVAGKQIRLLYFRSGSGGPGGYPEGRVMYISWDGK